MSTRPQPHFLPFALLSLSLLATACNRIRLREPETLPTPPTVASSPPRAESKAIKSVPAPSVPFSHSEAVRQTVKCLNALSDTGASPSAIDDAHTLLSRLDATPKAFAQPLASVLRDVLSNTLRAKALTGLSEISLPLVRRAATACAVRGERKRDTIVLTFAGDCTFGTVNGDDSAIRFPARFRQSGRNDYPFALVRPWLLNDDLTTVNFEGTLTDASRTADKEWKFKGPGHYARIFPASSVEVAGIANNHSHDYREQGFRDTVANFKKASVPTFYQSVPYVATIRGIETVLIGDCTVTGENTTVIGNAPKRVKGQIKRHKKPGNIVVVVMHWGSELDTVPRSWQQTLARQLIDAGADAIVGHHPHVVQGIERYKGKYIAYSLGNFAFGGNSQAHSPETFLLRLHFPVTAGKARLPVASVVPCYVTSSKTRNAAGVLRNNYQPEPVFGSKARDTVGLILTRSARLPYGVKTLPYLRLP